MLKNFALHDNDMDDRRVGTFAYDTATKQFAMTVDSSIPLEELPLSLELLVTDGVYDIGHDDALGWVRARICPPGRHNIHEILNEIGIAEYDEFSIISATEAKCDKDGLYILPL
jgi:hypothetical protein